MSCLRMFHRQLWKIFNMRQGAAEIFIIMIFVLQVCMISTLAVKIPLMHKYKKWKSTPTPTKDKKKTYIKALILYLSFLPEVS